MQGGYIRVTPKRIFAGLVASNAMEKNSGGTDLLSQLASFVRKTERWLVNIL